MTNQMHALLEAQIRWELLSIELDKMIFMLCPMLCLQQWTMGENWMWIFFPCGQTMCCSLHSSSVVCMAPGKWFSFFIGVGLNCENQRSEEKTQRLNALDYGQIVPPCYKHFHTVIAVFASKLCTRERTHWIALYYPLYWNPATESAPNGCDDYSWVLRST